MSAVKRRLNRSAWHHAVAVVCLTLSAMALPADAAILSRSTEISLGREAAQAFERTAVLDNDALLTAKIKRIGARLVSVSDAPDYPYEFHLVDSGIVNAFALPGGFIYIYRGLVQLLPNDDALGFVMAHEISHVVRRHSVRQLEKSLVLSTLVSIFAPRSSGAQVLELVMSMHYSRQDETEADTLGLNTAVRAGFDPTQGAEAMKVIRRAAGSGRGVPKLLRDHPLPDDRIARLSKQAADVKAEHARRNPPDPQADPRTAEEKLRGVPTTTINGLDGVTVAPCRYFPLKTGARWVYRTQSPTGSGKMVVTVLEMVPGSPQGVYRLEVDLGRGVTATQWVTTTSDRVLRRTTQTDPWRVQYGFSDTLEGIGRPPGEPSEAGERPSAPAAPADGGSWRLSPGVAKQRVPAGEFEAVKVECLSPDGLVVSTCWFAPEVGLIKRVSEQTGAVQELETLQMPRDTLAASPSGTRAQRG